MKYQLGSRILRNVQPYGAFLKGIIDKSPTPSEIGRHIIFDSTLCIVEYIEDDESAEKPKMENFQDLQLTLDDWGLHRRQEENFSQ